MISYKSTTKLCGEEEPGIFPNLCCIRCNAASSLENFLVIGFDVVVDKIPIFILVIGSDVVMDTLPVFEPRCSATEVEKMHW